MPRVSKCPEESREYRDLLHKAVDGATDLEQVIRDVSELAVRFGLAISVEERVERKKNQNCFLYAMGLEAPTPRMMRIGRYFPQLSNLGDFVHFMIDEEILLPKEEKVEDGDLVMYQDKGVPKHAGRYTSGLVVSKWGELHVFRHPTWGVPLPYGDEAVVFQSQGPDAFDAAFLGFAERFVGRLEIDKVLGGSQRSQDLRMQGPTSTS